MGTVSALIGEKWRLPAESALLYVAVKDEEADDCS